ncbi:MAG: hypothetical protein AAGA60_20440 [Cyanobacteria bacterium P01_E01_bin.42]
MMSKEIWNQQQGWLIPQLPQPKINEIVLAVSPDLSPLFDYQILELIQAAGFKNPELHYLYDEDESICAYYLGSLFEGETDKTIASLQKVGIHRDWILARPIDSDENIRSRPLPEIPIEYGLVPESSLISEIAS